MRTIKAKLVALIAVSVAALVLLSAATFYGLGAAKYWLDELGNNRFPSVESLLQMKLAIADARRVAMEAAIWENDYSAQKLFAEVLTRRKPLWQVYETERGHYEPLPQMREEVLRWRQFTQEIATYREAEERLASIIDKMSHNADVNRQKRLFVEYYKIYEDLRPLYDAAAISLDAVLDINAREAEATLRDSAASAATVKAAVMAVVSTALLLVILLGLYVYRSTLSQLGGDPLQVAALVRQVAMGDLRAQVQLAPGDQTSLLANMKVLVESMDRLASRADAVGKGDLSSGIELLSEHDRLGQAINNMIAMLRAGRAEDARRNWLKDGYSQLSAALTGDLATEQLAAVAISILGRYLEAGRGAFFIYRQATEQLEAIGSHGYTEPATRGVRFALGNGAVGRVAREKKPIVLSAAADAPPIVTGTSQAALRHTYTYPLLHEGELLGVVELASFERFDQTKLEFLSSATGVLASFLFVAEQRAKMRRLLVVAESSEQEARHKSEQLQLANRAKSVFLANMSHELRTPLNAILGFSRLLEREHSLDAESRRKLATIIQAGCRLLDLINDVLEITRIETGRLDIKPAVFNLHNALREIADMIRPRAEEKRLEFQLSLAADLPQQVSGDAHHLRQILINLLGNAVKYTDRGRICLRAAQAGQSICFEVADTGQGIAGADQEAIFRPFYQTESGIAKGEGTGLGLTISIQYARAMGGDLTLESEPGTGSVFVLTLPLVRAGLPEPAASQTSAPGLADGAAQPRVAAANISLSALSLGELAELRAAAEALDLSAARQIVAAVSASRPELAEALSDLLQDFRFDRIVELCDARRAG